MIKHVRNPYPEALIEEAVDDRVSVAVRHGQPMASIVGAEENHLVISRAYFVHHVGREVYDEIEEVQR